MVMIMLKDRETRTEKGEEEGEEEEVGDGKEMQKSLIREARVDINTVLEMIFSRISVGSDLNQYLSSRFSVDYLSRH